MIDDEFLKLLHHVLLEVMSQVSSGIEISVSSAFAYKIHVEEGAMVCQGCGHVYLVKNGIPNMVCEDYCCFI